LKSKSCSKKAAVGKKRGKRKAVSSLQVLIFAEPASPTMGTSIYTGLPTTNALMDLQAIGQPSPFLGFQSLQTPDLLEKFPRPEANSLATSKMNTGRNQETTFKKSEVLKKVIRKGDLNKPTLKKKKKKPTRREIGEYELSSDEQV